MHLLEKLFGSVCAQALDMLAGLDAAPAPGGGFTFSHAASGLAFAIAPAPPEPTGDDSDAEGSTAEPELAFQPLSLGSATEVRVPRFEGYHTLIKMPNHSSCHHLACLHLCWRWFGAPCSALGLDPRDGQRALCPCGCSPAGFKRCWCQQRHDTVHPSPSA